MFELKRIHESKARESALCQLRGADEDRTFVVLKCPRNFKRNNNQFKNLLNNSRGKFLFKIFPRKRGKYDSNYIIDGPII